MDMLSNPLVGTIKDIVRVNRRKIYIDNVIFRLHYRWTVLILGAFTVLVTSRQYIGDPIDCIGSGDVKKMMDQYCWIHSTFTRGKLEKGKWRYEAVKETEIYPGIRPATPADEIAYHTYYQWVWCVLLFQACAFYFPHWVWEKMEGGRVKMLVSNLNLPMLPEEKKAKCRRGILTYFAPNLGYHSSYAFHHFVAELLNLGNVIGQIYMTDYFLNYEFSKYGFHLFALSQTRPYLRDDGLARVFPTVTACRVATGGVAFGVVQHDILCILPINIINEKIYIFLWFLFIILAASSMLGLIYRAMTYFIPPYRKYLLRRRARITTDEIINTLCVKIAYSDWFLIYKLGQNMDQVAFSALIKELAQNFDDRESGRPVGGNCEVIASCSPSRHAQLLTAQVQSDPSEKALLESNP